MTKTQNTIHPISALLLKWYATQKRDLPWRNSTNAYYIWLSEIILQQTRVAQGMPYYLNFVQAYPTVQDLANAPEQDVLKLWQGLGYYSRARNLHAAAKMVVADYNGIFPTQYTELKKLKGVGEYTASAIASFAVNEPKAVVDGNVYRVLSRLYNIETPIDTNEGVKLFSKLAYELLPIVHAGEHNQAMMEMGATCCKPKLPTCAQCPVIAYCEAHKHNTINERPVKRKKTKVTARYFYYLIIKDKKQHTLIHQRSAGDIWQGLYEFVLIENEIAFDEKQLLTAIQNKLNTNTFELKQTSTTYKHVLSHQHLHTVFCEIEVAKIPTITATVDIPYSQINTYPLPRLIDKYLNS
jgi:A/G-specific adenine glycosylase